MTNYLKATEFLDYNDPLIQQFAGKYTSIHQTDTAKAIALFIAVRDSFYYNPYQLNLTRQGLKASDLAGRNYGYCVEKAVLLAAAVRYCGIPSRLFFGNVRNHIATEKLETILKTNVLVFHGSTELYLNERWVKVTPAFNKSLCEKLNVEPLEFDGTTDTLFQQYDKSGNVFMEYMDEYGSFDDMPFELYLSELKKHYGHLVTSNTEGLHLNLNQ